MTDTVAGSPQAENADADTSSSVSVAGGRFVKGHDPRRNLAGRIKKAPTVWDETQKLASKAKNRRRIAVAAVETMTLTDAAGNRARADYHDRDIGTVAHRMLVLNGEMAPADDLYAEIAGLLGERSYIVDAEHRTLPPPSA